jgi:ubiquitin-protein ligase
MASNYQTLLDYNYVISNYNNNEYNFKFICKLGYKSFKSIRKESILDSIYNFSKELFINNSFDSILNNIKNIKTDLEFIDIYGIEIYKFFQVIINNCNIKINRVNIIKTDSIEQYSIINNPEKENEFNILKKEKGSCYLWHGSDDYNWYTIMHFGPKIYSNTKLMQNGAAYGSGIYTSDNLSVSLGYAKTKWKVCSVFEVIGKKEDYYKSTNIYVVNNEKYIIMRYIFSFNEEIVSHFKVTEEINKFFNTEIYLDKKNEVTYINNKASKRIINEYNKIYDKIGKYGIFINMCEDNIYIWNIQFKDFDEKTTLFKQMQTFNIQSVNLQVKFSEDYPFSPPFIRVISPRFVYRTAHITMGGSICTEMLTSSPNGWRPTFNMENVLIDIKTLIIEGAAELDKNNLNKEYNEKDALEAFVRVSKDHGWN